MTQCWEEMRKESGSGGAGGKGRASLHAFYIGRQCGWNLYVELKALVDDDVQGRGVLGDYVQWIIWVAHGFLPREEVVGVKRAKEVDMGAGQGLESVDTVGPTA